MGNLGRDVLTGAAGSDTFRFDNAAQSGNTAATRDVIRDFTHLTDKIALSYIDAKSNVSSDQAFSFIGSSVFSGVSGQLHYRIENPTGTANDKTIVEGDVNGDRTADFQIELTGLKILTSQDFLL